MQFYTSKKVNIFLQNLSLLTSLLEIKRKVIVEKRVISACVIRANDLCLSSVLLCVKLIFKGCRIIFRERHVVVTHVCLYESMFTSP